MTTRYIDDAYTFYAVSTRFDTGTATDADAVLPYRVYEEETTSPLLTGNMALLDSANTAGLYSEQITLSAANGFEVGKCYCVHIAATVNSVVGATVREFVVRKKPLTPTTEGRELDVTAAGEAGLDLANVATYAAGAFHPTGVVDSGTAVAVAATSITLRAAAAFADSELVGATVVIRSATTGAGQRRLIVTQVGDVCGVDAWTTTPTGTIVYDVFGSPPSSTSVFPKVDVEQVEGVDVSSTAGRLVVNTTHVAGIELAQAGTGGQEIGAA